MRTPATTTATSRSRSRVGFKPTLRGRRSERRVTLGPGGPTIATRPPGEPMGPRPAPFRAGWTIAAVLPVPAATKTAASRWHGRVGFKPTLRGSRAAAARRVGRDRPPHVGERPTSQRRPGDRGARGGTGRHRLRPGPSPEHPAVDERLLREIEERDEGHSSCSPTGASCSRSAGRIARASSPGPPSASRRPGRIAVLADELTPARARASGARHGEVARATGGAAPPARSGRPGPRRAAAPLGRQHEGRSGRHAR